MFRLNDAVRRYQAQHPTRPALRCVATSVAAMSPASTAASPQLVAAVAVVATPDLEPDVVSLLIQQLREDGAQLQQKKNALLIRPSHWQQMDKIGPHWKAVLRFLQDHENGDANGIGRPA